MKKILLVIIISFCAFIILLGIIFLPKYQKNSIFDIQSKAFIDNTVSMILEKWDYDEALKNSSPELLAITKSDDVKKLFIRLSKQYGKFKGYLGSKGEATHNTEIELSDITKLGMKKVITASYICRVSYDNGDIEANVRLIYENRRWLIHSFHLNPVK